MGLHQLARARPEYLAHAPEERHRGHYADDAMFRFRY